MNNRHQKRRKASKSNRAEPLTKQAQIMVDSVHQTVLLVYKFKDNSQAVVTFPLSKPFYDKQPETMDAMLNNREWEATFSSHDKVGIDNKKIASLEVQSPYLDANGTNIVFGRYDVMEKEGSPGTADRHFSVN